MSSVPGRHARVQSRRWRWGGNRALLCFVTPRETDDPFWTHAPDEALASLGARREGLRGAEVAARLAIHGPNLLRDRDDPGLGAALLGQLRNPLTMLLGGAAVIAGLVGEWSDTVVIAAILLLNGIVGIVQERRATHAVAMLRARVRLSVLALRDGALASIPAEDLVPGDVVELRAGSLVPADCVILSARDFFVSEAILTGESFPVEKAPGPSAAGAPMGERRGAVWMGTTVRGGSAMVVVARTGRRTELGGIAHRLVLRAPETDFERGLRRFGMLLGRVVLVLVVFVFAVDVVAKKPAIDSLLFAIALAVGIAPEMLPAIVTVTLARGAREMAKNGVIVKRLAAIESFGSMDRLCTDKTGTLTQGLVRMRDHLGPTGERDARVLELARINASLETGIASPLDDAILERAKEAGATEATPAKVDEICYDFARKRLSVVVDDDGDHLLITKGALVPLLAICTKTHAGPLDEAERERLSALYGGWGDDGARVLGVATRRFAAPRESYAREDEVDLCFEGFLLFEDPPKDGITETIADLARSGVAVQIISGDNRHVCAHVARAIGIDPGEILTGEDLDRVTDDALPVVVERASLFAEVDPRQKERIVLALRKAGHVVGYMGDGINDAPALHAADVSVSVEGAVDVAREDADFVLVEKNLDVLHEGLLLGRTTFANTLKYLYTTESANLGNMLSMAVASAFLPFLPLTAAQILLNNFLSDLPAMAIAGDRVDAERIAAPQRWDLASLRRFMLLFGALSSVFDLLTFGVLLRLAGAGPDEFRTGWFIESLLTELAVALVVRTQRPFYRSRPGRWLAILTAVVATLAIVIPYLPWSRAIGFVPLPPWLLGIVIGITGLYLVAVELTKQLFFRRQRPKAPSTPWTRRAPPADPAASS